MFRRRRISQSSLQTDPQRWHLIRRPNAIQSYGFLIVLDRLELTIRRISENIGNAQGGGFNAVLGQPVASLLGNASQAQIRDALSQPRLKQVNPLELTIQVDGRQEVLEAVLQHVPTEGLLVELFPKPTDALPLSRFYSIFRGAMEQIPNTASLPVLYSLAVKELRRLSGFDRVMLLRFGTDGHAQVVAEDRQAETASFMGMYFPASDFSREMRQLHYTHSLRLIPDTAAGWCTMLSQSGLPTDWDMAASALRAEPPECLKYQRNMGAQAYMAVSLMVEEGLWGLLVCQHRTPRPLPYHVRSAAEVFGQMVAMQIQSLQTKEQEALEKELSEVASRLVALMSAAKNPVEAAVADDLLLKLTRSDSVAIRLDGAYQSRGKVPAQEDVEVIAERILSREPSGKPRSKATQVVALEDAPPKYPELFAHRQWASGMLFLPLSRASGDYVVWFREEVLRELNWAGKPPKPGEAPLPRASFEPWKQEVFGHSRPWQEAEILAAQEFAKAMPELLLRQAQARLAHMVLHDPLTGLPSRSYLQRIVQPEIDGGRWQGSLVSVDFDRFKLVNDLLGQQAGDTVLKLLAKRFHEVLDDDDSENRLTIRMGGDEFLVVASNHNAPQAQQLGRELSEHFRRPLELEHTDYFLSSSMGVAQKEPQTNLDQLISRAESALSEAKRSGRNNVMVYDPLNASLEARNAAIEQALRRALRHGEFEVYFQPIVLPQGQIVGAEALLRWQSPELGWVAPSEFIPIAEDTGLIGPLGRWALERSLWYFNQWREVPQMQQLSVSVNLSVKQLTEPDLLPNIENALQKYRVGPQQLRLEVTETSLMENPDLSRNLLAQLSERGIRISIDDFGTGFSSLSYVRALPIHQLKIDRSFLYETTPNNRNQTVLSTIVRLAHELGLEAVAEGVETEANRQMLTEIGCDLLQGYLFGHPLPPEEFLELYQTRLPQRPEPN